MLHYAATEFHSEQFYTSRADPMHNALNVKITQMKWTNYGLFHILLSIMHNYALHLHYTLTPK